MGTTHQLPRQEVLLGIEDVVYERTSAAESDAQGKGGNSDRRDRTRQPSRKYILKYVSTLSTCPKLPQENAVIVEKMYCQPQFYKQYSREQE